MSTAVRPGARGRLDALLGVVLASAIVFVLNYLAYRHYTRFDWTSSGAFTLSDRSRQVLRGLDRDVTFTLLVPRDEEIYGSVDELLRGYQAVTPRVHVERVDPFEDEGRFRAAAARLGLVGEGGAIASVDVVVSSGTKRWNVRREDLVRMGEASEAEGPMLDVGTESALTAAVLEVVSGRKTRVCLTSGHGELALGGEGDRSADGLRELFARDNVELSTAAFSARAGVPRECDAAFVLGPERPFDEAESNALGAYVDRGGKLVVAVDPVLDPTGTVAATGLESMLFAHGILLGRDLVVERDADHLLGDDPFDHVKVDGWTDHPLVAPLRRVSAVVAMHSCRSVQADDAATAVVRTTPLGFAARDVRALSAMAELAPGPADLRGPVSLAAAFPAVSAEPVPEAERPRGRLVVVGDTDFLRSELLEQPALANGAFASSLVGYVTERPALISIPPRRSRAVALMMPADGPAAIRLRVMVLLPLAFVLLGIAVHSARRA